MSPAVSMITPAQRAEIRHLMRRLEWDTRTITILHTRTPGMDRKLVGRPLDKWLDTLDVRAASTAITWLRNEAGTEDEE